MRHIDGNIDGFLISPPPGQLAVTDLDEGQLEALLLGDLMPHERGPLARRLALRWSRLGVAYAVERLKAGGWELVG